VLRNTRQSIIDQYQEEFGIEIDEKEIKNIKEWSVE
jgi:acyl carrier protein